MDSTASSQGAPGGRILARELDQEMRESYLDYAMSVLIARALPDIRDGLKPVHRRILYAMFREGLLHNKKYSKSAGVVGEVLKRYHPHGDSAVYDSMVRLAQPWNMRYPLVDGQGNFGCFTVDTRVKLTDGRALSFGELVAEHKEGKKNFTYTIDSNLSVKIAEIVNPRLTKKNSETVRVTLDNDQSVRCTPDHRFMLLNGKYVEAQHLKPGQSLMPGYFRHAQKTEDKHLEGYEMVFQPHTKEWSFSHQLADKWNIENGIYAKSAGRVRHHANFNKLNNNPSNIIRLNWGEHLKLHSKHAGLLHEKQDYREKIASGREKFWADKSNREKYSARISQTNKENWKNEDYREQMRLKLSNSNKKYIEGHPEKRSEFSKRATETLKRLWKIPQYRDLFHQKIGAANKKRETNNTGRAKFIRICHETLSEFRFLSEEAYEATRKSRFWQSFTTWKKGINKYYAGNVDLLYKEICQNHKVVKVEHISEKEDVYDLTINDTHNFLLDAGVFVHNSIDGDSAAAYRYTEARLTKLAEEMLADIDKGTVNFVPNFDAVTVEPTVLPTKIPSLLLNGSSGIAVGMATNIPPHNFSEVASAINATIDKPDISIIELMHHIKGPDFPTGGIICGLDGVKQAYTNGKGLITIRAKTSMEKAKDRQRIIVSEVPYQVNKANLVEEIADLVNEKKITGISDLRDESDRDGTRIVVDLKKDANPEIVLNQLFTHTRLESTFGIAMIALVNNEPKTLSIKEIITHFIAHRKSVIVRRTQFDLNKAEEKAHLVEGLLKALANIDAVIDLIRKSKDGAAAKLTLISKFSLSEKQALAVLDMRLQRLASLEQEKLKTEYKELIALITELKSILASEKKIFDIIKKELEEVRKQYADERRTAIEGSVADVEDEDLITPIDVVVTVTHNGYIKRLGLDTYKQQKRGGRGVIGTETNEQDFVEKIFVANTHSYFLFFTDKGIVHWLKVHEIPEASRNAMGKAIVNLLELSDEKVTTLVPVKEFDPKQFLLMATMKGTIKKTTLDAYSKPRRGGIIAITLEEGDSLIDVELTDGNKEIIIATANGIAARFNETDVRPTGRSAQGVRGIKLKEKDEVIGMVVVEPEKSLLTLTENGYGKRTEIEEYRLISRGGQGVISIQTSERNGKVVAIKGVSETDDVVLISKSGIVIRVPAKGISVIGRNTQGVRIMKLEENDKLVSAATIKPETTSPI